MKWKYYDAAYFIDRMMNFYKVDTMQKLAQIIGITQQSISKWKKNNYTKAMERKCEELGIYLEIFGDALVYEEQLYPGTRHLTNEIFGDLTNKISVNTNSGQIANTIQGNQTQSSNDSYKKKDEYIIPEIILDDINILFKLAVENNKEDILINLIDEFIFKTKQELRKK